MQETEETQVGSLDWEDLLEQEMATYSSILAWKIPWTLEPGGLQSMRSQKSWTQQLNSTNNVNTLNLWPHLIPLSFREGVRVCP